MNKSDEIKCREFLTNNLHKKLIQSDEEDNNSYRINGKHIYGYRLLAMKYWPEEFNKDYRVIVHHINLDRSDNRVCNLVVLTYSEHKLIHYKFEPGFGKKQKTRSDKGKKRGKYNKTRSDKGKKRGKYNKMKS